VRLRKAAMSAKKKKGAQSIAPPSYDWIGKISASLRETLLRGKMRPRGVRLPQTGQSAGR
jgi:hypothetical protein